MALLRPDSPRGQGRGGAGGSGDLGEGVEDEGVLAEGGQELHLKRRVAFGDGLELRGEVVSDVAARGDEERQHAQRGLVVRDGFRGHLRHRGWAGFEVGEADGLARGALGELVTERLEGAAPRGALAAVGDEQEHRSKIA